jgi:hypothetical protein
MFEIDEPLDPLAELERLIVDNTCQWCGETKLPQLTDSGKTIVYVRRLWLCREEAKPGYKSKHWRYWRVCDTCQQKHLWGGFDKWIFPVIANMPQHNLMEQLVAVQPMAQPAPQVMYMDFVYADAERVRLPERHPLLRRYAEVGIDHRNYGRVVVDVAADKADATALVAAVLKNREPVRGRKKLGFMLDDANFYRCR